MIVFLLPHVVKSKSNFGERFEIKLDFDLTTMKVIEAVCYHRFNIGCPLQNIINIRCRPKDALPTHINE